MGTHLFSSWTIENGKLPTCGKDNWTNREPRHADAHAINWAFGATPAEIYLIPPSLAGPVQRCRGPHAGGALPASGLSAWRLLAALGGWLHNTADQNRDHVPAAFVALIEVPVSVRREGQALVVIGRRHRVSRLCMYLNLFRKQKGHTQDEKLTRAITFRNARGEARSRRGTSEAEVCARGAGVENSKKREDEITKWPHQI